MQGTHQCNRQFALLCLGKIIGRKTSRRYHFHDSGQVLAHGVFPEKTYSNPPLLEILHQIFFIVERSVIKPVSGKDFPAG
jgi:hypothetical protein